MVCAANGSAHASMGKQCAPPREVSARTQGTSARIQGGIADEFAHGPSAHNQVVAHAAETNLQNRVRQASGLLRPTAKTNYPKSDW